MDEGTDQLENVGKRSMQLLRMLYEKGKSSSTRTLELKQDELARQLGISRQALNTHLRKLRDLNAVRTGRGFIDVTEKGVSLLGLSSSSAFVLIKISPVKRIHVYERIATLPVQGAFRVAGDIDAVLTVEREKLDETLKRLYSIDGIVDTRSYVTIENIK
jgi:DNA-binding Lrp family transcriptional regulator